MLPRTIRARLVLLVGAVVLPALALAGLLIYEAQRNERLIVERRLAETSRALSLVVDRQIGQAEAVVTALSTSIALARRDFATFYRQANTSSPGDDVWIALARTSDRQQLVNTSVPYGTPLPVSRVPADYVRALAAGQRFVSDLFTSPIGRGWALAVTIPVRDSLRTMYDLTYVMTPRNLSRILEDQSIPSGWVAAVIDKKGVLVARNRAHERFVGRAATSDVRARVLAREQGVFESTTLDGQQVVASLSRSPTYGWTVIIGAPRGELYSTARKLATTALLVSLLLVAAGLVGAVWVARGVVGSIDTLSRQASRLGEGDVPTRSNTGMRETDSVAEALVESARRLHAREDELRRLNETLEQRVSQRTRELGEANRALEIRNRELQDFAYVASHDLQEPLRKVQSFGDLLRAEYGDAIGDQGRHYVERMQAATERMSRLIKDLLAFSRVATQTQAIVPVDLDRTLAAVQSDLEVRVAQVRGRIEAGTLGTVEADPLQMHQLLLNLIGNALKFHRKDMPPVVQVSAERRDGVLRLVVEDNGIGFDQKHAERIFSPFQRLHARHEYEGTGMGLAIVRRIVERHGGTVSVRSTPGQGSRFEVTLPAGHEA